jgi:hypothetical protein
MQTNFRPDQINLSFNEWITTGDAFSQVIISPPLEYPLDIKGKGKSIRISFDEREELRENATYTLNFGEYVKDFTAGNTAWDLRFVFSTGPYIDSLSVSGRVIDAFTLEPVPKVLVMLYNTPEDSVVRQEKPFYFSRTDESGNFRIENVRADTFKLFALIDNNLNYLFDLPNEQIAFVDSLLVVSDSTPTPQVLRLFSERLPLRLQESETETFGYAKAKFSRNPFDLSFRAAPPFRTSRFEILKDSLRLWYLPEVSVDSLQQLYFSQTDGSLFDTLAWEVPAPSSRQDSFLRLAQRPESSIHPDKPFELSFQTPLEEVDTSRIAWFRDTIRQARPVDARLDSLAFRSCFFREKWQEGASYKLILLPGALTDIFQTSNDSLVYSFKVADRKQFGTLRLNFGELPDARGYIISLLDNGDREINVRILEGGAVSSLSYPPLMPGEYRLQIIADLNGNGVWDPGDYFRGRQPEPVFRQKLEPLRANWELEVDVNWEK